ncbi:hypothetical protein, partial [Anoxybacillus flavithermus]|uniref:hypothetical protein n=1 Tax=Anoxybacillus flavithermus TaxID=33934 RepID=UPI0019D658A6
CHPRGRGAPLPRGQITYTYAIVKEHIQLEIRFKNLSKHTIRGLLHSWGGHYAAAGLTIHPDNVKTFFDKIEDTLSKYPKETWIRKKYWDGHIRASDINETLFTSVDALEPFGQGFPKITWKLQGMLVHRKIMKNDPDKLRGTILIDGELEFPFIMWEKGLEIEVNTPYTLYGHFQFNDFFKHMEFNIIDFQ